MTIAGLLFALAAALIVTTVAATLTAAHLYRRGRHAAHLAHRLDTLPREDH